MTPRRFFASALSTGVLAAITFGIHVPEAFAQEQSGYAANHMNPSERGSRWFVLDSLEIKGDGRLAIGMVNDYSYRSLVEYRNDADGHAEASIVRNQLVSHLGASMVVGDRFRIGASVPLQLFADGHTSTINGVVHRPAEDAAVGDVRLAADVRVLGDAGGAATVALGSEVFLPSGSPTAYTGDGKPRAIPRVLFAGQSSNIAYAARLGFQIRERNEVFGEGHIGSGLVFGASAGAILLDKKMIIGPEIFGSTVTARDRAFDKQTTPIEVLLGLHYDVGENVRLGAGSGVGLTRGYGAPVYRALLSLEWVPGDAKPEAAKPADVPAPVVCPPLDADRDGILDEVDACPLAAGVGSPDARKNGCPADRDSDGIIDAEDACVAEAGPRSLDPKLNGCPVRDRDGDSVIDTEDACPDQSGPRTTDPKTNGCPDPDRDKDGVTNDVDACPDEPGKADPDPKKNGCPKAFLEGGVIKILDQVKFKTASAEIAPGKDSEDVLNAVLGVLKAHPEVAKIRVEGHTDDRGDAAKNKALSLSRAESVSKWLGSHGVDKARLSAAGFGSEKPIDSNTTEVGRTNNRRVEFHVEGANANGSGR